MLELLIAVNIVMVIVHKLSKGEVRIDENLGTIALLPLANLILLAGKYRVRIEKK